MGYKAMRRTIVTFLSIAASSAWSGAAHGIDVPIGVEELVPQGVAGRNRSALGVPAAGWTTSVGTAGAVVGVGD